MAKITQKQINDINSKCKNGFTFYIQGYVEAGRNRLNKTIMLKEDEKMVEVELYWAEEIVHPQNPHEGSAPHCTDNFIPGLRVTVWRKLKHSDAWLNEGFGNKHEFKEHPSAKKMTNKLCEVSELGTDELICSLLPEPECQEFKAIANLK